MSHPRIAAVATAVPEHRLPQSAAKSFARGFFADDFPALHRLLHAFDNTGIEERQLVRPLSWYERPHSFEEKNEVYRREALTLATAAAQRALDGSGIDRGEVGALVFVSTTGVSTPSLDSFLVQLLDLPRTVARLPVWGLGCAGGAAGLGRAAQLCTAIGKPVLLVAVEICSGTFLYDDRSKSNLIATALFGDGAAAAVVTPGGSDDDRMQVLGARSLLLDDSEEVMGWKLRPGGLQVQFARSIPAIVRSVIPGFVRDLEVEQQLPPESLHHLVFHPGGSKVLAAYAEALEVEPRRFEHAWAVLRSHGNMSSPTVLFVLERLLRCEAPRDALGLVLGLGPGFGAEGVLVRW